MTTITIRIEGAKLAATRIAGIPKRLAHAVVLEMSQIIYDRAQEGASRHRGETNRLFGSLVNRPVQNGREVGHDKQHAPHAKFVLFGTGPHIIRARNRKALRWAGPRGYIFAKWVRHPGYRGDNYLYDAAKEAIRRMPEIVAKHMENI